ncbi:MAG TPA: SH3 domain-containing protein [Candidatus Babeliales bacterium]|jgi:tetratricopeptide (TPR) repeat protein|nr:SH3 domain-containing protein [Candidatus Babeliales bacterium]
MQHNWYGLFIILYMGLLYGQNEQFFLNGNNCYQHGDYQKALEWYQKVDIPCAVLMYNIGNCFYNMHHIVDALVYWSRAQKTASVVDLRTIQNHKLLAYKVLHIKEPDPIFYNSFVSFFCLQSIVLILWFFVCIVIFFLRGFMRWILLILGIIALSFGSIVLYKESYTRTSLYGYVNNDQEILFAGPGNWYHQIGTLPYATCVEIVHKEQDWYAICTNTTRGWVPAETIKVI